MSYLRNIISGAVTESLDPQGVIYQALAKQRTTKEEKVTPDPGVIGEGTGGYNIPAGEPIWEDIPAARASSATSRVSAGVLDPAAVGADVQTLLSDGLSNDITVTAVSYTPSAAIKGADTNSRTVSVLSGTESGVWHEKEADTVNVVAKEALVKGVESAAGVAKALTLESAEKLKVKAGLNVVALSQHVGTGIVDPGGIVLVTYTHD